MRQSRTVLFALVCAMVGCRPSASDSAGPAQPLGVAPLIGNQESVVAREPRRPAGSPLSLTASDGTGLRLVSLKARATAETPLAFTEVHLTFENPSDRVLEGTFRIALAQGASVSRFAMRIGDAWQEGEVVDKRSARAAYEDFLHRKQDPALLEQSAGNEFSARVFPIPARGKKELIISYSEELVAHAPYVFPLAGLPQVESVDVTLLNAAGASEIEALHRISYAPEDDFVVDRRKLPAHEGLRHGDLALVRVRPLTAAAPDVVSSAVILVDTSASRALSLSGDLALVQKLAARVAEVGGPKAPLAVIAFDQTQSTVFDGEAAAFGPAALDKLRARGALGASDLEQALLFASDVARARGAHRLVIVTDGVATAGETDLAKLGGVIDTLRKDGIERMDAVATSGVRDDAALRALVTRGLARDGIVVDGALGFSEVARRIGQRTQSKLAVNVEGARWWTPRTLDAMQPGDEALVYAELAANAPVRLTVGGGPAITPTLASVDKPLLERSWAKAKIASLLKEPGLEHADVEKQVVALSTAYRVLSPFTSLLVLEAERDYERFHIDRTATTNILTFEDGRLVLAARGKVAPSARSRSEEANKSATPLARRPNALPQGPRENGPLERASSPAPMRDRDEPIAARGNMWGDAVGDAFGSGGLGLSGAGEGGGGRGDGIGLGSIGTTGQGQGRGVGSGSGSHRSPSPSIRQGASTVSGRLPPEVIQRIVRQNFGRFRLCYEAGLRADSTLAGRVTVAFEIEPSGAVLKPADGGSTLPSSSVVQCVVQAFSLLAFPSPESGTVRVVYPIVFAPAGDEGPARGATGAAQLPRSAHAYTGRMKSVMDLVTARAPADALRAAKVWHQETPGDVMAIVALGEAQEASGNASEASRAYGSLVDLFPNRADLRRYAGERLERVGKDGGALALAVDTYRKAAADRPDHPSSHRLLAFALVRSGKFESGFDAIAKGIAQRYPSGRFAGVERILREDAGLIAAAWIKSEPFRRGAIQDRLRAAGATLESGPSLRFVLNWETDANDVDFHIFDDQGHHASFESPKLESGGELYADVTTGYGPECFTIRKPRGERAAKYTLQAHYYSRGPMGYGMGKLQVIEHDGKGELTFDERPFVVMVDRAFVDLGTVSRSLGAHVATKR